MQVRRCDNVMRKYHLVILVILFVNCNSNRVQSVRVDNDNEVSPIAKKQNDVRPSPAKDLPSLNRVNSNSPNSFTPVTTMCKDFQVETSRERDRNLINIITSNGNISSITLPTGGEKNGFALNFAKKTRDGFLFSIEYGSRFYYEKEFYFVCKKSAFYLTSVMVRSHDQADPESSSKESKVNISPKVALDKFNIDDFMKE